MKFKRLLAAGLAGVLLAVVLVYPSDARLDELILPDRTHESRFTHSVATRYLVREGDSLWQIALEHRVNLEDLLAVNGTQDPDLIRPGQLLTVPGANFQHRVRAGENLTAIAALHQVPLSELVHANELVDPDRLFPGQRLCVPVGSYGGPVVPAAGWRSLVWPAVGSLTSVFGIREDGQPHFGIDIAADHGDSIKAAMAGRVVFAGPAGTFGLLVVLNHGDGLSTYYAHCSAIVAACGDWVDAGELIARVGNTGRSFGPHLHFEVRWQGQPYDPMLYLAGAGVES